MYEIKNFEPRLYQKNILETTKHKNTLVCLPTGMGKTKSAILLAVDRLNSYSNSKVLVCTPTKPLSNQICNEFRESTNIPPEEIRLVTGAIKPEDRKRLWENSKVIVGTPQTFKNDFESKRISFEDVSLLCIDESHRSRQKFANTHLARYYTENSRYPRIIALTASPGFSKEKIDEIRNNLYIDAVEIRTETDEDVSPYIQERPITYVKVDLTDDLKKARDIIKTAYRNAISNLKKYGLSKPSYLVNKRDLISFQSYLRMQINRNNRAAFSGISLVAQALKLSYVSELIETQTVSSAYSFLMNLEKESTKAARLISNNKDIQDSKLILKTLFDNNIEHPKIYKLKEIVKEDIISDKNSKIIIFANYRDTVDSIIRFIEDSEVRPIKLVGQKEGITQKIQLESIKKFEDGIYNVLVCTSIGEEGLSINNATHAIFYDTVPSEIRAIQRAGRVGRTMKGKITTLITKSSRDQAYLYSSRRKEFVMKKTLHDMQDKNKERNTGKKADGQSSLMGF